MKWNFIPKVPQYIALLKHFSCNRNFERNIVNLSYRVIGDDHDVHKDPPVIILHGLLSSKRPWNIIGKTLKNVTKRLVVTVDLRNHGSSPHKKSHKYKHLAVDVMQLLHKLKIKKPSVIGHDMGGRTAMYMALNMSESVERLLVVDISPVSTSPEMYHYKNIMTAMKEIKFNKKKEEEARTEAKNHLKNLIKEDKAMLVILRNLRRSRNGSIKWKCNLDTLIKNFHHISSFPHVADKHYDGPTLFVGGQMSTYIPPDDLNKIRELFPLAVIQYIKKTGHYLHIEDPKSFLELAIRFLNVKVD